MNHMHYTGMASKTPVSGVPSNGFLHQAPKVIASHEMSIECMIWKYLDIFKTSGRFEVIWNYPELSSGKQEEYLDSFETVCNFELIWNYPEICFKNSLESRRSYGSIRTVLEPFNRIEIIWKNVWKVSNHPGRSNSIQRVLKVSELFGRFFDNICKNFPDAKQLSR